MTLEQLMALPETKQLRQTLLELSLVSHVRGVSYDSSGGSTPPKEKSGMRPPGGLDHKGDRESDYRQKSHNYFLRRFEGLVSGLDRISDEKALGAVQEILDEAKSSLKDWRHTPRAESLTLERDSFEWKIAIAKDERSSRKVAKHYGVSHVTVLRYRKEFGNVEA